MHRRARHLNPKSAGAMVAWDARFISGLNGGDAVSTWTDRSGGTTYNAAQSTSTLRPTYQLAVQGGQPAVRFDGGDRLDHALSRDAAMTVLHVLKVTGGGTIQQSASFAAVNVPLRCSLNPRANSGTVAGSYVGSWISAGYTTADFAAYAMTDDASGAITFHKAGTNGNSFTGQLVYTDNSRDRRIIGGVASISEFFTGDFCFSTMFPSVLAAPLRRRIEQAASFSFKIQCS